MFVQEMIFSDETQEIQEIQEIQETQDKKYIK